MSAAEAVSTFRAAVERAEREARERQAPPPRTALVRLESGVWRRPKVK